MRLNIFINLILYRAAHIIRVVHFSENIDNDAPLHSAYKIGQFHVVELMLKISCSINLSAQHVNGMTHFDLTIHCNVENRNFCSQVPTLG